MNRECGARLIVSRTSGVASTVCNLITCKGSDNCPFEDKLNGKSVQFNPTQRGDNYLSQEAFSLVKKIQPQRSDQCLLGYSLIEKTNQGTWDIQPNKSDRTFFRILNRILPRSNTR